MKGILKRFYLKWIWVHAVVAILVVFTASCKKEEQGGLSDVSGTLKDADGNVYKTIVIGNQEWMAENLRTTRFSDGSPISSPGPDNRAWETNSTGAYSWYKNDEANFKEAYGALYNWHAVSSGKLCPAGWRVPADDDWTKLNRHLAADAGNKLKWSGSQHWQGNNSGATNETGFNALPGGVRYSSLPGGSKENREGYFYYLGKTGRWWTATGHTLTEAWYRSVYSDQGGVYRSHNRKGTGFSVRCMRD